MCACILLGGTWIAYWPATRSEFVNLDDSIYVSGNTHVQPGLTWPGLKWAFGATAGGNWHPLTWVSHMVDCQIFGPKAGGHHFTSILFHSINACLLFALMLRLMRRLGASFVIAALFAWHPLHVESVAWVAERKDVLSTCFGLLSLLAYAAYAEAGTRRKLATAYTASLLCFVLSLMSKPMLVTLPIVMALLDFWPLQRKEAWRRLALEKAPFLLFAAIISLVTIWAQAQTGAIAGIKEVPLPLRIANAELSYLRYLWKLLWPENLAVFYPFIAFDPGLWVLLGAILLLAISLLAIWLRRFPYIPVGWFWFFCTLVPVIGVVQVGSQAMADRYTYFPSIGIFILAVFGVNDLASRLRRRLEISSGIAAFVLLAFLVVTRQQVGYWRNSESLFRHAALVTRGNFVACNNLGAALMERGDRADAVPWFVEAVRIKTDYADAHCNLGECYIALKRPQEAIAEFESALRINPRLARAHYLLANQLLAQRDIRAAEAHYRSALAFKPDYTEAHYQIAVVSLAQGQTAEACDHFRAALRLKPDWIEALNNLAWVLATHPEARFRDGTQAVALAERGVQLTQTNDARLLDTLSGAFAEVGRFDDALASARTGARLAQTLQDTNLKNEIETHITHYQNRQPFRDAITPKPEGPDQ